MENGISTTKYNEMLREIIAEVKMNFTPIVIKFRHNLWRNLTITFRHRLWQFYREDTKCSLKAAKGLLVTNW